MSAKLKKIEDQVIVITGASSGIGLATARAAARRGARVVLAARNEEDLLEIAAALKSGGWEALAVPTDVSDPVAVDRLRNVALDRYGRIDTWINNAGVSIYGKLVEVDLLEARRLFDVNFWGVVHGSRAAVSALRDRGGAIINIGSVLSDRVIPVQGMYAASKHAVKGYTDALRVELEKERIPISVTLVRPSAIDTPHTEHARNHMNIAPHNAPPIYAPSVVGGAILFCAEHRRRDVVVGGGGKVFSILEKVAPRLTDRVMEASTAKPQRGGGERASDTLDSLFMEPLLEGRERGRAAGRVFERSAYTQMSLHPLASAAALASLVGLTAIGVGFAFARLRRHGMLLQHLNPR